MHVFSPMARLALPLLFVLIWSSGFIAAKFSAPYASPLALLSLRFGLAGLVMAGLARLAGAKPVRGKGLWAQVIAGVLLHGAYLGPVFWAIAHGMPAGVVALITGLQPFMTVVMARMILGEAFSRRHGAGLVLGLLGVGFVVVPKLTTGFIGLTAFNVSLVLFAVFSIALGTVWQKAHGGKVDLRAGAIWQYGGAMFACLAGMAIFETPHIDWESLPLWLALFWMVFGLSIGAISLLLILLKRGSAGGVASFIYLVPGVTAVMAYLAFGESLLPIQIFGMMICAAGVALIQRR